MPRDITASYANVQEMAEQLRLSPTSYRRAIEIAPLTPGRDRLLRQIDRFLIAIGALLVVAGIAVFFAWNWADLGPAAKFALIQGGIVVVVVLAWRFGLDSLAGRASLLAVDNKVRVGANDAEGRRRLARYMIRNPFSLEKMEYKDKQGVVVYRSKLHATLKRNFQIMPGAAWLKLLLQHVPDRGEHLVRYYGWYSNRSRGRRKAQEAESGLSTAIVSDDTGETIESDTASSRAAHCAWARLIRKVYEVEPLNCPHCGGEMRFLSVIEEAPVIERILRHVGAWEPRPPLRGPPDGNSWPDHSQIPLTYHPVPDIA